MFEDGIFTAYAQSLVDQFHLANDALLAARAACHTYDEEQWKCSKQATTYVLWLQACYFCLPEGSQDRDRITTILDLFSSVPTISQGVNHVRK